MFLVAADIRVIFSTESLLTSQFYTLWGPHALEAYILSAKGYHGRGGNLSIKIPPERWSVHQIRNSASIFEEYYLPLLHSPIAKGSGADFFKIYERSETETLLLYFYFLKDRESFIRDINDVKGDINEMLCIVTSKYSVELGTEAWRPYSYSSAYPYIAKLIRLVDTMAASELSRSPGEQIL